MAEVVGSGERRRLERAREALADASGGHALAAMTAVQALFPGGPAHVYELDVRGHLGGVAHTFRGAPSTSWSTVANHEVVTRWLQFDPRRPGRHANRAVDEERLFENRPDDLELARHAVLTPNDVGRQLRVALYARGYFVGFCGTYRRASEPRFRARDAALLDALVPDLLDCIGASRAVRDSRLTAGSLGPLLEELDEPAFLLSPRGAVVFANASARATYPEARGWRRPSCPGARVSRLDLDGNSVYLLLPRSEARALLPPHLARVAALVAAGRTDKEIASATGLSVSTVRTYVTRVYRTLGVHNRVELARRLR